MIDHGVKSGDRASHLTSVQYRLAVATLGEPCTEDVGQSPTVGDECVEIVGSGRVDPVAADLAAQQLSARVQQRHGRAQLVARVRDEPALDLQGLR